MNKDGISIFPYFEPHLVHYPEPYEGSYFETTKYNDITKEYCKEKYDEETQTDILNLCNSIIYSGTVGSDSILSGEPELTPWNKNGTLYTCDLGLQYGGSR